MESNLKFHNITKKNNLRMIKNFKIFEKEKNDLIGLYAVLINPEKALYMHDKFFDTKNNVGFKLRIDDIKTIDDITFIVHYDNSELSILYYNMDNFELPKRIFTKDDPFGEEDWKD